MKWESAKCRPFIQHVACLCSDASSPASSICCSSSCPTRQQHLRKIQCSDCISEESVTKILSWPVAARTCPAVVKTTMTHSEGLFLSSKSSSSWSLIGGTSCGRSRLAACELAATGAKMKASERLLICSRILLLVALVTFFWRGGRGGVGGRRWEASVEESKARLQVRVQELLGCTFCLSCLQGGGGRLV